MPFETYNAVYEQLFSWEKWDLVSDNFYCFYDVTLKVPCGDYQVGEKFSSAAVDFEKGFVEFYSPDGAKSLGAFRLILQIGEKLEV